MTQILPLEYELSVEDSTNPQPAHDPRSNHYWMQCAKGTISEPAFAPEELTIDVINTRAKGARVQRYRTLAQCSNRSRRSFMGEIGW